jgi:hypothetical protein
MISELVLKYFGGRALHQIMGPISTRLREAFFRIRKDSGLKENGVKRRPDLARLWVLSATYQALVQTVQPPDVAGPLARSSKSVVQAKVR